MDWVARNSLLLVMLGVLAAILLSVAGDLLVADSWMTLVSGREIVEHGLPSQEALTELAAGREWIDQQWLAQLAFYGAWALGGLKLALILDVVLVVAAFASAVWFARARGASARSTLFCARCARSSHRGPGSCAPSRSRCRSSSGCRAAVPRPETEAPPHAARVAAARPVGKPARVGAARRGSRLGRRVAGARVPGGGQTAPPPRCGARSSSHWCPGCASSYPRTSSTCPATTGCC